MLCLNFSEVLPLFVMKDTGFRFIKVVSPLNELSPVKSLSAASSQRFEQLFLIQLDICFELLKIVSQRAYATIHSVI